MKTEYDANAAFLYPYTGEQERRFFYALIPMSEKVYEALGRVLENRRGAKATTIDGYNNFLFLNRDGCPKTNVNYATMFRGLAKKYNKTHEEALPKVKRP